MSSTSTAGIIVIGDEILKGHTRDTNSTFLLSRLWSLGVTVKRVVVVPDDVDAISETIKEFSNKYSLVFTSGGIGPTHDDVTMAAVAKSFNEDLVINNKMSEILKRLSKQDNQDRTGLVKMSLLPVSATLTLRTDYENNKEINFPHISVKNVHILPGIPEYLEKSFTALEDMFRVHDTKFYLCKIYVNLDETEITEALNVTDARFKEKVHLGSYPVLKNDNYKVKLTLESDDENSLADAYQFLLNQLPEKSIVSIKKYLPNSREKYDEVVKPQLRRARISSLTGDSIVSMKEFGSLLCSDNHSNLSAAVKCAWAVMREALNQYELNEICVCFNGGKDCTVLLHLWLNVIMKHCQYSMERQVILYIQNEAPFDAAEDFIKETATTYDLDLIVINGHIKEALAKFKSERPLIKACLMGTRRHDPFSSSLRSFSPTDPSYPNFMRINPLLDWTYAEIWDFLITLKIPYCRLYDEGFTSLGSRDNTVPNPYLKNMDGSYNPAFMLSDEKLERSGRK